MFLRTTLCYYTHLRKAINIVSSCIVIIIIYYIIFKNNNVIENNQTLSNINDYNDNISINYIIKWLYKTNQTNNLLNELNPNLINNWTNITTTILSSIIEPSNQTRFRISSTKPEFKLYLHPPGDLLSDSFYKIGYWNDCKIHLSNINKHFGSNSSNNIVIIDVGANIGSCTLLFSSLGYKIYAFEPYRENYRLLSYSIINNIHLDGEIILITAGTSNLKNISEINIEIGNAGNNIVGSSISNNDLLRIGGSGRNTKYIKNPIRLTTLDHIIKEHVHYMKMDCQGSELSTLLGAKELLDKYKIDVIAFEYTPSWIVTQKQNPIDLLILLDGYNYTIYRSIARLRNYIIKKDDFISYTKQFENNGRFEDLLAIRRK